MLWSVPQVPDRVGPLLTGTGESPLPAMARGVAALNGLGVDIIAIACNTAHAWHGDLAAGQPGADTSYGGSRDAGR